MGGGGAAGADAGGAGMIGGPSGLPIPPGPGGVAQPTGTPGNLHVLNWAGFESAVTYTFDDAQASQIESRRWTTPTPSTCPAMQQSTADGVPWALHGYYEIALDAGAMTVAR